jgi:hypothetical protein
MQAAAGSVMRFRLITFTRDITLTKMPGHGMSSDLTNVLRDECEHNVRQRCEHAAVCNYLQIW